MKKKHETNQIDTKYKPQKVYISAGDMLDIYEKGEHRSSWRSL